MANKMLLALLRKKANADANYIGNGLVGGLSRRMYGSTRRGGGIVGGGPKSNATKKYQNELKAIRAENPGMTLSEARKIRNATKYEGVRQIGYNPPAQAQYYMEPYVPIVKKSRRKPAGPRKPRKISARIQALRDMKLAKQPYINNLIAERKKNPYCNVTKRGLNKSTLGVLQSMTNNLEHMYEVINEIKNSDYNI